MIHIGRIINTVIEKGIRQVRLTGLGRSDHKKAWHCQPFGINSNPSQKKRIAYATTGKQGQNIAIGVIQATTNVATGETEIYSEDGNGEKVFSLILKNDGTAEIGGDSDFAVRFNELKSGFDELRGDLNSQITDFATHFHLAPSGTTGTPLNEEGAITTSVSTASIDGAKIENIKVP